MSNQFSQLIKFSLTFLALCGCSPQTMIANENRSQFSTQNTQRETDSDQLLVVDCLLPGQVRKLGTSMTFIAPRRPVRTTGVDCGIRGGEYVAYDRADYRTALNVWLGAAKEGDAKSQVYVGEIFEKGLGTVPDYLQAATWYRRAAMQGNSRGAINLGYLHEKGLGVEKNTIEALNWYRKASGLEEDDLQFASTIEARNEVKLGLLRETIDQKEQERKSLQKQLQSKEQQLRREQTALNNSEQSLEELKQQLDIDSGPDKLNSEQVAVLQTKLLNQRAKVLKQREENATLKQQLEKQQGLLTQELDTNQQQHRQQLDQAMAVQREELNKLRTELVESKGQLASAQRQLNESNEKLLQEQDNANRSQQKVVRHISENENTVQKLTAAIGKRETDIERLQQNLTSEINKNTTLEQKLQQGLTRQRQGTNTLNTEYLQSQQNLANAETHLEEIKALLDQERKKSKQALLASGNNLADVQRLQAEIIQREKELAAQHVEVTKQREENAALKSELVNQRNELSRELGVSQQQHLQFDQAAIQQRTELNKLNKELYDSKQQLADAEKQLVASNSKLIQERNITNKNRHELTNQILEKENLVQQLAMKMEKRSIDIEKLQKQLNSEMNKTTSLKQELERGAAEEGSESNKLQDEYIQSQQKLAGAEHQLEEITKLLNTEQNKTKRAVQSSTINLGKMQRLRVEVIKREKELEAQRKQITNLQSEMARYTGTLNNIQNSTAKIALLGPSIEIIDPPISLTRGIPSAQLRTQMQERVVIGKVDAPSGLLALSVNDTAHKPDKFGLFRASIPLEDRQTLVSVVAVDKQGRSAKVNFNLLPKLRMATTPLSGSKTKLANRKHARYPVDFGSYHALIIGNNNYTNFSNLNSAVNDAKEVEKILRDKYAFKTTLLLNGDRYSILSALNKLREELTENDNLLIYYAGHGELDQVNQRGHWLPVDAEPNSTANWISNIDVTDILNAISAKHIMVVADSCYSGTMTRSSLARLESGMSDKNRLKWFKVMARSRSRTVLTSGGLKPVLDSGRSGHSVFANAFFRVLNENNEIMESYKIYRRVSEQVNLAAAKYNLEQTPQYAPILHGGHEAGEFFFVPRQITQSRVEANTLNTAYYEAPYPSRLSPKTAPWASQ